MPCDTSVHCKCQDFEAIGAEISSPPKVVAVAIEIDRPGLPRSAVFFRNGQKMNIAYLYDSVYPYSKGGGERRIYEVARRLAQRGHRVSIYGMNYWNGQDWHSPEGITYRPIAPVLRQHGSNGSRSASQALAFGLFSSRLLGQERYDVIDCAQFPYLHLLAAKTYAVIRRSRFVVSWYEVLGQRWVEYLGSLGIAGILAERAFCRIPKKIVAISEVTRAGLLQLGVKPERISVILDGVDCRQISSVSPGPVKTDLAYCGRLKSFKNVHLLVSAVALLKKVRPDIRAVVVGDGPEAAALHDLASELGVSSNIIFTGSLDNFEQVIGWIKASKIFVHPSTKEGGSSMTLFEANASGLPVIAARCTTGIDPSLIEEGRNGYFVEPTAGQIADHALALLDNPTRLAENSVASKEMAVTHDWDAVAAQYERVYEDEISLRSENSSETDQKSRRMLYRTDS